MGKKSAPPPPDYSGVAAASKENAELARATAVEQLAWAKEQWAAEKVVSDKVVDQALDISKRQDEAAQADRKRYEETYQPLEDQLVQEAKDYDSPERRDREIGAAQANVAMQGQQARDNAAKALESFGINPASTRYAGLDVGSRTGQAAASAAAGTQADRSVEAVGRTLRSEALNIGKGYPGQIAGAYQGAINAGNSAGGNANQTFATGSQAMGNPTAWMGSSNQAIGQWGNTLNMGYQNQLAGWKAEQDASSGWGSALGMVAGIGSKLLFAADGGAIDPEQTPGGAIPVHASPSRGHAVDDVPAALTVGEFVVPRDVAAWKGEEFFQKLIDQSRQAKDGAQAKPEIKRGPPQAPAFTSRPQQGAIPVGAR